MQIRRLIPDECETLGLLTLKAYRDLERVTYLGPYENELVDVAGRDRDSEVYVALDDEGRLLGGVTYVPDSDRSMSEFEDPEGAGIRMLAVDPDYQGAGVGRALVETCIAQARIQNRRRVILHSTPAMVAAQALYEKVGFERTPKLDVRFTEEPFSANDPLHLIAFILEL